MREAYACKLLHIDLVFGIDWTYSALIRGSSEAACPFQLFGGHPPVGDHPAERYMPRFGQLPRRALERVRDKRQSLLNADRLVAASPVAVYAFKTKAVGCAEIQLPRAQL